MLRLAAMLRRGMGYLSSARLQSPSEKLGETPSIALEARPKAVGWSWTQHPMVRARINSLVSGSRNEDLYRRYADFLGDNGLARPLRQCASLGCGAGGLERDLVRRGLVGAIDGYDPSEDAITEARRLAAELNFDSIRYYHVKFDETFLPEARFDAVFTYTSLHRVQELESIVANVRHALKPDGIFHLNEFVGPSRFQWSDAQLRLTNEFLDTLPERLLQTPNGRKPFVERSTIEQITALDGTLAVRSSEIREVLAQHFDIVEERPYGGTLLHIGLSNIAQNFDVDNPDDMAHLERFFSLEDHVLKTGALGSDFTVLTAVPASPSRRNRAKGDVLTPVPFGTALTRQLRPSPNFERPGLNLTVSKADTMLGAYDDHYISVGQSAISAIERALQGTEPRNILDLPCGFGRVTRALRARFPHAAITVSDLDRPGVDFSAREFGARAAYSVRNLRELDLGEVYDLIWVGSLITHLPTGQTRHLLSALRRHLSPKGSLLVTLQGPSIIPRLRETGYGLPSGCAEEVIAEYERTGFGYRDYDGGEALYGVSLSNDNYGISLTSESWMAATLEECGLHLHAYEVQAWDNHHDIVVARRLNA